MTLIAVWALVKRFWWLLPIVAAVWFAYSWAYDRGEASQEAVITSLTNERNGLKHEIDDFTTRVKNQNDTYATAVGVLKLDQQGIVTGLTNKLNDAESRAKKTKILLEEVTRYVSAKSDSNCVIPVGFVRLHDSAANNTNPSAEATGVAASGSTDVDAPSGVTLSAVASTVNKNYANCNESATHLSAWQEWYPKAQAAWNKAAGIIDKAGTVAPPKP